MAATSPATQPGNVKDRPGTHPNSTPADPTKREPERQPLWSQVVTGRRTSGRNAMPTQCAGFHFTRP